jgi:hypothetical protein
VSAKKVIFDARTRVRTAAAVSARPSRKSGVSRGSLFTAVAECIAGLAVASG